VDDALRVYEQTRGSCLRYSGLKDVGATPQVLAELTRTAHDDGLEVMLEVVSTSTEDEMGSLRAAAEIGVDWVLGGTHAAEGVAILRGRGIKYCPFPGRVIGHPSELDGELDGELEEIAEQSGAAVDQDARVRGSRPRGRRVRPWQPNDATERRNRTTQPNDKETTCVPQPDRTAPRAAGAVPLPACAPGLGTVLRRYRGVPLRHARGHRARTAADAAPPAPDPSRRAYAGAVPAAGRADQARMPGNAIQ